VQETGTRCWKFANAQFSERTLELTVADQIIELERKPLEVLRKLLLRAGDVVSHQELLDAVWPGRIVSESVLKKCVSRLREALQDRDHAIVKTVHGYGYRLIVPAEIVAAPTPILLSPPVDAKDKPGTRHCAVLIVDIAGTVDLRARLGDAAAGRSIMHLLNAIIAVAGQHGGDFIKSYGDDVLAIFEHDPVNSAARAAIAAQQLAADAGLQLYAGLHSGEVEFRETMGHPDALGLTVNFAARLHKLTEGAPGRIFLAEASVNALAPELRLLATRYGWRDLKGIGAVIIWTLDWHDVMTTTQTLFDSDTTNQSQATALRLRHGTNLLRIVADQRSCFAGRGKDCDLRLSDPESRISSTHLLFEHSAGRWFVQDISRNGTWLRDGRTGEESLLPYCTKGMLPRSGQLCLGRPFTEDVEGRFVVEFELDSN
jgi:DNA-binding winged helix-turn-helix (wHTH) protein